MYIVTKYRALELVLAFRDGPNSSKLQNSTTSFLTATALIYAIGAGVTAAAGTRLALQWKFVK